MWLLFSYETTTLTVYMISNLDILCDCLFVYIIISTEHSTEKTIVEEELAFAYFACVQSGNQESSTLLVFLKSKSCVFLLKVLYCF